MLACKLRRRSPIPSNTHRSSSIDAAAHSHPNPTSHNFTPNPSASWTAAIRSATQLGRSLHALSLYTLMHRSNHRPDPHAISAALKSCARIPSKPSAAAVHAHALKLGHHSHLFVHTALLHLYSILDSLSTAQHLFDEMPTKNVVTWNSLLSSHLRSRNLASARKVFDEMPVRDVVSWNSMISGYAKTGDMDSAALLFRSMPEKNSASWNGMMSGYIARGDMKSASELFDGMIDRSNVSWISMISGYARCGQADSAWELFVRMEERDVFSWNAMISCYAQNGRPREALRLFNMMHVVDGLRPDEVTFSSALSACSQLGEFRYGLWIEKHMVALGMELDDHLGTALIDLYSKCGGMDRAFELFGGLRKRDLVSFSAMILGCGINGMSGEAIMLFKDMLDVKIKPNAVTFVGLLTAYNHAGLVEEGRRCFYSMRSKHQVAPSVDHYAIMVDLLGRSRRLEEAYQLIEKMPMQPHVGVWGALLHACRLHGNVKLGEIAAQSCFELEAESTGYYVQLASIYAEAGEWDKAKRLRKLMVQKGLAKVPGCSWLQIM